MIRDRKSFIHPRQPVVAAILPVGAPSRIGALGDVEEAFFFIFEITVIIDAEDVAEIIERKFLHIAQAVGEDFEI